MPKQSKQSKKEKCRIIFNEKDGLHANRDNNKKAEILKLFVEEAGAAPASAVVYYSQIKHEANNTVASSTPQPMTAQVESTNSVEETQTTEA